MHRLCSRLMVYSDFGRDSILNEIADIIKQYQELLQKNYNIPEELSDEVISRFYRQIKRLLDLATVYGFDGNLWQNYLTYLLMTNENSYTLTVEKREPESGSIDGFVKNDYSIFIKLFNYDFSWIEKGLGIDCFSTVTDYRAIEKRGVMYNAYVSEKVRSLSSNLAACDNADEFYSVMAGFYAKYGVGIYATDRAFRCKREDDGSIQIYPINNTDDVVLSDLVGYELQKEKLIENTEAFVKGKPANNCLLYGDSGTGKSTAIKAICNEYFDRGLRLIELYKHQCRDLSDVIASIKNRNYSFIIYMDDLSFEEFETEYKYLKAVIEGGVEKKPANVLIYATSNRRHLIRESWSDRSDMDEDLHRSDTMQEKLSLFNRFGVTIAFGRPDKKGYNDIVVNLARRQLGDLYTDEELIAEANKWELAHGGMSGRTARQFIDYLAGKN